jgi:hypothetical protein
MGLNEASSILWRERQLLEVLHFKLEEEQLLIAAGRTRWVAFAAREVEEVLDRIRLAEVARAIEIEAVATELGLPPNASLQELVDAAPEPWNDIFASHRDAFLRSTQDIVAVAETNRELISRGVRSVEETLAWLSEPTAQTYSPTGEVDRRKPAAMAVDEAL